MDHDLLTVAQAAQQLQLHTKTVLRFIREGRLPATRIGKSYRLRAADLRAFAGSPARAMAPPIRVTCIVEIPAVSPAHAERVVGLLHAMLASRAGIPGPLQCQSAHDVAAALLKIVLIGQPAEVASLLDALHTLDEARE